MPKIETFDAGNLALRPTETGVESQAGAARRINTFFNQQAGAVETLSRETDRLASLTDSLGRETSNLGSEKGAAMSAAGRAIGGGIAEAGDMAVKAADHQQISHGEASWATLLQQATQDWENTKKNADPNDPTVAAKFMDSLNDRLSQFQENGFYTENAQKWAETKTAALRQHMAEKTMVDMSSLAGEAAAVNLRQTINSLSATVHGDPSSIDFALAALKHSGESLISSSPNLKAEGIAHIRGELGQQGSEAIVKAAAIGYIDKTGKMPPWATDPKYAPYINSAELQTFEKQAQVQARMDRAQANNDRVMRDYTDKQEFHKAANELEISTIPSDPSGRPTLPADYWQKVRKLADMPGASLEPQRLKSMVENGERITERLNKAEPLQAASHATTIDLLKRIRATDESRLTDNDEIYKAYGRGDLNTKDFNFLQREFANLRTPEGQALNQERGQFFKQYAGAIAGRTYDPVTGSPKLYAAEMDARRVESDLKAQGKNPLLAYDPTSEYFIGKPENIAKWSGSMQSDLQTRATTPAPKREDVMPAIPPASQRTPGLYDTPKGKLRWTGTGWVQP